MLIRGKTPLQKTRALTDCATGNTSCGCAETIVLILNEREGM
jgi:hypothetical protein